MDDVAVTQADREAAYAWIRQQSTGLQMMMAKPRDIYEAFARHRLASYAEGRRAGLEEAAKVMENLCFFTPVDQLPGMTKQEMSVRTCHEGAAAIRALTTDGG